MKILYTTDLHGSNHYYNMIFKKAQHHDVDLVINGGDLLPKTNPIFKQQKGYVRFLERMHFPRWEKAGIHYICCPGNDDARIFDPLLADACNKFEFVHFLSPVGDKVEIADPGTQRVYEFIAFNLVCDYPFGIKDRCRMDRQGFEFPPQRGTPAYTIEREHGPGWEEIDDWFAVARELPTMEDELKDLVKPRDSRKAVYIMHMPPAGVGLDECQNHDRPSGWAVREFLEREQPLLSLHGHIHESFRMTGIWKAPIGRTWAVQPGQGGMHPVYCVIDLEGLVQEGITEGEAMQRYGHKSERVFLGPYDSFIKLNDLPEYLRYHFSLWMASKGIDMEEELPFPYLERFVLEKGLNIKLLRKSEPG